MKKLFLTITFILMSLILQSQFAKAAYFQYSSYQPSYISGTYSVANGCYVYYYLSGTNIQVNTINRCNTNNNTQPVYYYPSNQTYYTPTYTNTYTYPSYSYTSYPNYVNSYSSYGYPAIYYQNNYTTYPSYNYSSYTYPYQYQNNYQNYSCSYYDMYGNYMNSCGY